MLLTMIGEIKVSRDRFGCLFFHGVLGICRLVVSLFRQCVTFCKEMQVLQYIAMAEIQVK